MSDLVTDHEAIMARAVKDIYAVLKLVRDKRRSLEPAVDPELDNLHVQLNDLIHTFDPEGKYPLE